MVGTVSEISHPQTVLKFFEAFIDFILLKVDHRVGDVNHPEVRMVVWKSREDFSCFEVIHQGSINIIGAEHKLKEVGVGNCIRDIVSAYFSLSDGYCLQNLLFKLVSLTSTKLNLSLLLKH